jgi:hypothetical protein
MRDQASNLREIVERPEFLRLTYRCELCRNSTLLAFSGEGSLGFSIHRAGGGGHAVQWRHHVPLHLWSCPRAPKAAAHVERTVERSPSPVMPPLQSKFPTKFTTLIVDYRR